MPSGLLTCADRPFRRLSRPSTRWAILGCAIDSTCEQQQRTQQLGHMVSVLSSIRWPAPIEDVPVDHVRRLVDYYRRKRHAASLPDTHLLGGVRMPLLMESAAKQESFNKTAQMYGVDTQR